MFTGKPYSRSVRGHLLCATAIQSLLMEKFWNELSISEKEELQCYYDSNDPNEHEGEDLSARLKNWIEAKHEEVSKDSRTSALWSSLRYIGVVQDFIRAERTNDWNLHVTTTNAMLNLFGATGHHNYAKSCILYLQSDQETKQPDVYAEFLKRKPHCSKDIEELD